MNLWHEIERGSIDTLNVIIEIPKNSPNKYEIDKATGLIALDRANYSAAAYPFDYGFVPRTLWEDNDPLDVIVMTTYPLHPGILVQVRPLGVIEMIDDGESDYKIIAVPVNDRRWEYAQDIDDINAHTIKEYMHFFETYKALKKDGQAVIVEIPGYKGRAAALEAIQKSFDLYDEKYGQK
ncbi:MAG: inorganic diphosphatase [Candidatus Pacebacteria bacterium]|nr:inorganic diphosphatase [Candidatus Paceibacterota bacterium]MCD8508037.1 inorganic diphosphatase [Candidatus Paceibacterota bacterium]MCD8528324.1 inorganic diphosphatase [Candidatus Paceibacterota bacterium]MCD8563817.1 inorganic diphosphatase [Candidatus Paceibacterota bacterium]